VSGKKGMQARIPEAGELFPHTSGTKQLRRRPPPVCRSVDPNDDTRLDSGGQQEEPDRGELHESIGV
jgi:hypothetical protein